MEFEIEEPIVDGRDDDEDGRVRLFDRPVIERPPILSPRDRPATDQAICIPEQEDG